MFARHEEYVGDVRASPTDLFSALDDQFRLSAHMSKRSWKMGWGKMDIVLDAQGGHAVGSQSCTGGFSGSRYHSMKWSPSGSRHIASDGRRSVSPGCW